VKLTLDGKRQKTQQEQYIVFVQRGPVLYARLEEGSCRIKMDHTEKENAAWIVPRGRPCGRLAVEREARRENQASGWSIRGPFRSLPSPLLPLSWIPPWR
jgi:hypothetical protein